MSKRTSEKGIAGKLLICMAALALILVCMPMSAQTVSAEEQVKIELTYLYVNTAGDTSLYVDTQYVPAGTTWSDFFNSYQTCYTNGVINDADAGNTWTKSIQSATYIDYNDESLYADTIQPLYADFAYVTFYGKPSTYKPVYVPFTYFVDDEYMDSGIGGYYFVPVSCVSGSDESLIYAEKARHLYTFFDEYCSQPGASITWELTPASDADTMDCYYLKIFVSSSAADTSTNTGTDTNTGTGTNSTDNSSTSNPSPETSYTTDSGEVYRRIAAEGNVAAALDGVQDFIPSGSRFTSTQLTAGDAYARAAALVAQKIGTGTNFIVYEMNLSDASNTAIHQLNGYVNVTFPIPDGFSASNGKLLIVYRVEDDGTLTRCDTATANGCLTFSTNHFSTYVLVEQTGAVSPKTGDVNTSLLLIFAAAAVVCSMCFAKKSLLCK